MNSLGKTDVELGAGECCVETRHCGRVQIAMCK